MYIIEYTIYWCFVTKPTISWVKIGYIFRTINVSK